MMFWLYAVRLNIYKSLYDYFGKEGHFEGTSKMNHFQIDDLRNEPLRKLFTQELGHFGKISFPFSTTFLKRSIFELTNFAKRPILQWSLWSNLFPKSFIFELTFFVKWPIVEVTILTRSLIFGVTIFWRYFNQFWSGNFWVIIDHWSSWLVFTNRQIINHNSSKISNRYMDVLERLGRMPPGL